MNPTPQTTVPHSPISRWVLLGVALCLAPFVVLGLIAASYLTLDRSAATLRKQVMAATDAGWSTKIQLSLGGLTLGVVRSGLSFVHGRDMDDARLALAAVRRASVGVYERTAGSADWSREQLFINTDQAMAKRGWARLVGVAEHNDTVLVYVPQNLKQDEPVEICVAVVNGREIVVVSTSVDADKLGELAARHVPADVKHQLHLARLKY